METGFFSNKYNRTLGSIALAMVILALASYAILNFKSAKIAGEIPANISVTGVGEVVAIPNIAQFSFSVTAGGATADEVQKASATKINDVLAYLKEQGVEDKDVKTEGYNLYPKYKYEERMCAFGSYCPPGEQVPDGFEVSQTVTVKVRDTAKAGTLVAGVGGKGATNISGINFIVDDLEKIKAEARAKAIDDAEAKAKILAEQLGVKTTRILSFSENQGYAPQPYYAEKAMAVSDNAYAGAPSLPAGEDSTTVTVNITYEIK